MAWGRVNEQWNHTASLIAALAACHTDAKSDPPTMAHFHPFLDDPAPPVATADVLQSIGFRKKQ